MEEEDNHDVNNTNEENELDLQADEEFASMSDIQNYFNFGNNNTNYTSPTNIKQTTQTNATQQSKPIIAPRLQPSQFGDMFQRQMPQQQLQQGAFVITSSMQNNANSSPVRAPNVVPKLTPAQPQIAIMMPPGLQPSSQQGLPIATTGFNANPYQQYASYLQFLQVPSQQNIHNKNTIKPNVRTPTTQTTPTAPITMVVMQQPTGPLMSPTFAFPLTTYPPTTSPRPGITTPAPQIVPPNSLRLIVPPNGTNQQQSHHMIQAKPAGKLLESKNSLVNSHNVTKISLYSSPAGTSSSVVSGPSPAHSTSSLKRVKLEAVSRTNNPNSLFPNLDNKHEQGNSRKIVDQSNTASTAEKYNNIEPVQNRRDHQMGRKTSTSTTEVPTVDDDRLMDDPDGKHYKRDSKRSRNRSKTCQRWTEEQNRALREAVLKHGPRNWKKIAVEIGGLFTADQCNQHWHRVLNPRIIKGDWTADEDDLLFSRVSSFGESSWTKIAEGIPGRTDIQCRHRYFQRKKEIEIGVVRSPSISSHTTLSPTTTSNVNNNLNQSMFNISSVVTPPPLSSTHGHTNMSVSPISSIFSPKSGQSPRITPPISGSSLYSIPPPPPPLQQPILTQEDKSNDPRDYRRYSRPFTTYGGGSRGVHDPAVSNVGHFSYIEKDQFGISHEEFFARKANFHYFSDNSDEINTPLQKIRNEVPAGDSQITLPPVSSFNHQSQELDLSPRSAQNKEAVVDNQSIPSIERRSRRSSKPNTIYSGYALEDDDDEEENEMSEEPSAPTQYIRVIFRETPFLQAPISITLQTVHNSLKTTEVMPSNKPNKTAKSSSAERSTSMLNLYQKALSSSDAVPSKISRKSHISKLSERPVTVNRMRGNINVFIPWCEAEEQILKSESQKYEGEPDFANILTQHSSAFHPLRTPQFLQKHYHQLKEAGVDFNNIDAIPPEYLYINNSAGDDKYAKKSKATKLASEKKRKDTNKGSHNEKKGTKRKKDSESINEDKQAEEQGDIKSSITGRLGGKKRTAKKKSTNKKASKKRKTEESNSSILFEALNIIDHEEEDSKSDEESQGGEDPMVSVLLGLSQVVDKANVAEYRMNSSGMDVDDKGKVLTKSIVTRNVASIGVGTTELDESLLTVEGEAKMGEKNITYRLQMDENENCRKTGVYELQPPYVMTSNKITIRRLHSYLIEKLELRPSIKLEICLSGKMLDPALRIDHILTSYDLEPQDLLLTYRSRTDK